jgi:TolB-like protein/DNA-binding winged helix-turn-helix (wHTH) protein/Tfp pilus assembly protein PilF
MQNRIYQFAEFRLSLADGHLRSGNASIHLQEKPLQLLATLLDHPQLLVTRQQLRERMWNSRTVVDYEQGINVAMRKVRDALGDSAETPRFIQTVARKGYRFLVPVELVEEPVDEWDSVQSSPVGPGNFFTPADSAGSANERRILGDGSRPRLIAIAFGLGLVCTLGIGLYGSKSKAPKEPEVQALAVLPLQDLSPDSGQEYLVDGITEEIITGLARELPVRVISRTSVMQYRHTNKPIAQIARELGVDAIVEGSVARSGDRITVTVQLIDATADRHLWARQYDRQLADILAVEADLSRTIASQIHSTLTARQMGLPKPGPVDPKVYELCLLGRYHWNKRTEADFAKAEDYFQQAIARDPNYAPAHAGLADVYALASSYSTTSIEESRAKAVAEANLALALNDDLAEAHATLGIAHLAKLSEWSESETEFRRAIEIDPNYANAHHWLAYDLWFFGRKGEALAEIAMARQLDPLSAVTNADEGHFLYAARRFDDARVRLQRAIELAPELGQPHATLALVDLEAGHSTDALREAHEALALDPDSPNTMGEVGFVMASAGEAVRANELLTRLQNLAREGSSFIDAPAMIQIGLGQEAEAVNTLRDMLISFAQQGIGIGSLSQWHAFDALADNPRYRELVTQTAKLPRLESKVANAH